ncbi:MmgE/PrpD family protein [Lysinibacillus fusiformis]|nr:MmgE/PrpD family protein [Lysinibacillus fusiformis]
MYDSILKFYKTFSLETYPKHLQEKAKLVILDSVSIMLNDGYSERTAALYRQFRDGPAAFASFVQGVTLVSNELDEGNMLAKGHPSAHFLPALLQVAIERQATSKAFLESFIVGYEISARFGEIIDLKPEIHPHANWGLIGGGFAFAKLLNIREDDSILRAAGLAAQFAFPTLWKPIFKGDEARNIAIGLNNLTLTLLPRLLEADYGSDLENVESLYEDIIGTGFHKEAFQTDFSKYYLEKTYFKFYDSCRFCHGPIDAVLQLIRKIPNFSVNDLKSVVIDTYANAAKLHQQNDANHFAGKFSIPYAIATAIYNQVEDPSTEENIQALASKIMVKEDPSINALLPSIRATRAKIQYSKKLLEHYIEGATGDENTEFLDKMITQKAEGYLRAVFDEECVQTIKHFIFNLEKDQKMGSGFPWNGMQKLM